MPRKTKGRAQVEQLKKAGDRLLARGKAKAALKKYRRAEARGPRDPHLYHQLIQAHQVATEEWTMKDFVESLTWEMRQQELEHPELRDVHAELSGRMRRIGLTGGLGTGKSTVARMFTERGFPVIDADATVHRLLRSGTPTTEAIVEAFGAEVRLPDGGIDRTRLGAIVFADAAKRKQLEGIVHPAVRVEMERQATGLAGQKVPVCILDIPLLFESGYDWRLHAAIVVACDPLTQLAHCRAKFGWSEEEARRRIATQMPLTEKIRRATFVIENSGSLDATRDQVDTVIRQLAQSEHRRDDRNRD